MGWAGHVAQMGEMNWMHLAENSDQWWAVVNMVMNYRFHERREI